MFIVSTAFKGRDPPPEEQQQKKKKPKKKKEKHGGDSDSSSDSDSDVGKIVYEILHHTEEWRQYSTEFMLIEKITAPNLFAIFNNLSHSLEPGETSASHQAPNYEQRS